ALQADHLLGEVGDPHLLAHVEDEDLALRREGRRLYDEARCFVAGHEESRGLGISEEHRPAALDLTQEERDDAAAAAHHVAEADGSEGRRTAVAERRDAQFANGSTTTFAAVRFG